MHWHKIRKEDRSLYHASLYDVIRGVGRKYCACVEVCRHFIGRIEVVTRVIRFAVSESSFQQFAESGDLFERGAGSFRFIRATISSFERLLLSETVLLPVYFRESQRPLPFPVEKVS